MGFGVLEIKIENQKGKIREPYGLQKAKTGPIGADIVDYQFYPPNAQQ